MSKLMSHSARIEKIGDFPTSPELLLSMVAANEDDIESIVISVVVGGLNKVYWSKMTNADMAFHVYGVQEDLRDALREPS